jgi:tetratricopeptide (TPR) repeat protein
MNDHLLSQARNLPSYKRFTDDELSYMYSVGYTLYSQKRYTDAANVFTLINIYRPFEVRYLKALAACQQMRQKWNDALDTYELVLTIDPEDNEAMRLRERCQASADIDEAGNK